MVIVEKRQKIFRKSFPFKKLLRLIFSYSMIPTSFSFIIFFVANVVKIDGFYSEQEVLTDIEVKPCFAKEKVKILYPDDSLESLYEVTDRQFCVSGKTNKSKNNYDELKKNDEIVTISPSVRFKWSKLGYCVDCETTTYCPIKYYGYQETYRLSPDFGYYKECNSQLSQYRFEVVQSMNKAVTEDTSFTFPFHYQCPIKELPLKFESQSMCSLKSDHWYVLEYSSINEIELRNKSTLMVSYKSHWVFSTHSEFYHDSGHEKVFLLKIKAVNCSLKVLTLMKSNLPFDVNVEMRMSYSPGNVSESNVIAMNGENLWDEIIYHFSTNYSSYSVDFCYKGNASVKIGSRNVTAFISNGNQWLCAYNRIRCFPPLDAVSTTNVNWSNRKLVVFLVLVIRYNVLLTICTILN